VALLKSDFDKDQPSDSPDGRWIAYTSVETDRWEIYVATFPGFNQKRLVSNAGGRQPLWCKDGKELFYLSLDGKLIRSGHTDALDNRDRRPSRVLSAAHPKRPSSKSILRDTR